MAFSNRQNNSKDATPNVNTRGHAFMNKDGFDPSAMRIDFWNEMLSIRFNPALEPSKQTETRIYDYDKTIMTSLSLEKTMVLIDKIENEIFPAIAEDRDRTIGISVGGDSLFVVGTGKKLTGSIRPFVGLHKSLDPQTKIPEMSISYEFKRTQTIDEYDPKTGKYELGEIQSELTLFLSILKNSIGALSNAYAHASRSVNQWRDSKRDAMLNSMAEKQGVTPMSSSSSGGYRTRSSVDWGTTSSSSESSAPDVDMEELNSMDDINNYM